MDRRVTWFRDSFSEGCRVFLPEIFQKILQDRETVNTKLSKGLERLFENLEREVGESLEFDAAMSGSTCVLIFIILNRVYCANIGDSRAVFGFQNRDKLEIKDLSRDHKPELPSEMDRIRRNGGTVESMRCKLISRDSPGGSGTPSSLENRSPAPSAWTKHEPITRGRFG